LFLYSVKLNSVEQEETSRTDKWYKESSGSKGGWFRPKTYFNSGISTQQTVNSTSEIKREYSMEVTVIAGQTNGMPRGMERILDLFETIVRQQPKEDGEDEK
jgi:hypothetical protein